VGGRGVLEPAAGAATLACFFGTDAAALLAARPTLEAGAYTRPLFSST